MHDPLSLLYIDDECTPADPLVQLLALSGIEVDLAFSGHDGIEKAQARHYDTVLLDVRLPDMFGLTVLDRLLALNVSPAILVTTAHYLEPEIEAEAMRRGARAFLHKPLLDSDAVVRQLRSAAMQSQGVRSLQSVEWANKSRLGIVAASMSMQSVMSWVDRISPKECSVLVTGETGTGKDLVARAIHQLSRRHAGPFVAINCAAITEGLAESELFGHRRGSFTGANADKRGLFEAADRGTLFLDEIAELSLAIQAKLLRAVETGQIRRIGDTDDRHVDVRIVAATNCPLSDRLRSEFREDLYYRLAVVQCTIPPLRARPEDIEALASLWLTELSDGQLHAIEAGALMLLKRYPWRGNARELRSVCERMAILTRGSTVRQDDVTAALTPEPAAPTAPASAETSAAPDDLLEVLARHDWNRTDAARTLGINRTTLWRRLNRYHSTRRHPH